LYGGDSGRGDEEADMAKHTAVVEVVEEGNDADDDEDDDSPYAVRLDFPPFLLRAFVPASLTGVAVLDARSLPRSLSTTTKS
jgi:hypothetical protein